jgi:tetratricopeptide (TPR) repeat protein
LASRAQTSALSPAGRIILGQAYLQAEDYDNARQQFAAAVAAAPRLANAHYGLANALTGLGQTELALKHREAYAQLKQEEYAALDHRRGAGREIEKVDPAEVRGVVAEFCLRAGKRYAHHGRLKEAETHWLQALRLDPRNPVPRELLESLAAGRRPAAP